MNDIKSITAQDYASLKKTDTTHELLDVRTPDEFQHVNIGGLNIPLQEIEQRYTELNKETSYTVMCHHGRRSAQACFFLQDLGFDVQNMDGGIDAWSREVDPETVRY